MPCVIEAAVPCSKSRLIGLDYPPRCFKRSTAASITDKIASRARSYTFMDKPGHRALRKGRVSLSGQIYHLTLTSHERRPLFLDLKPARIVAQALNEPSLIRDAQTFAWCLMPDHLHWLVQLGDQLPLSRLVQYLKSATSKRLHQNGTAGKIWSAAFHDHALRQEEDLETVARYIVANPLRAGLVTRAGDYSH